VSFTKYLETIAAVRELTLPTSRDDRYAVRHVVVVLTSSRSGSSYFKQLMAQHPAIATLTGEEEPYNLLTFNGFPFTGKSDAFNQLYRADELASYIWQDLTVNDLNENKLGTLAEAWWRRFPLQILRRVGKDLIYDTLARGEPLLETVLPPELAGLYDGSKRRSAFQMQFKIEEPPFVHATDRLPIAPEHLADHVLLFKTPQDAYRIGLFEKLYPEAKISYIHLTRGFAQTVNGLMDGWESNYGFFSHNLTVTGIDFDQRLNIKGYSDRFPYGLDWWKFDLPPNWREYVNSPLPEVCMNQWESAHSAILYNGAQSYRVKYEDLMEAPLAILNNVFEHIGLTPLDSLPEIGPVMATEPPCKFRWRKRAKVIMDLAERPFAKSLMNELGYSMDPGAWS